MTIQQIKRENAPVAMEASKWLSIQVLLDEVEMEDLVSAICLSFEKSALYYLGSVVLKDQWMITLSDFLTCYGDYVKSLKNSQLPNPSDYKKIFSAALSANSSALYALILNAEKYLLRAAKPIIQLQPLEIHYSIEDKKFRPLVFGQECISWGVQFSYPQIYLDVESKQVVKTQDLKSDLNRSLFNMIQKWVRSHTIPTPFVVEGKLQNVPMRLGKRCLPWINLHPGLLGKGVLVKQ